LVQSETKAQLIAFGSGFAGFFGFFGCLLLGLVIPALLVGVILLMVI
jgi:hypothetical protein